MKGIVYNHYGAPDVLEWVELDEPRVGANEVLIEVEAVCVGPGDCKTRAGLLQDHHAVRFPKVPGRSGVGRIAATGQRVFFSTAHEEPGSCVERIARPVATLAPVPAALGAVEAAAIAHPGLCAWLALTQVLKMQPGESLLVLGGSGVVGMLAIQLGAHLGACVTATGAPARADAMRAAGARHTATLDAGRVVASDSLMPTDMRFDAVLDLVGGDAHWHAWSLLAPRGRLGYLHAQPLPPAPASAEEGQRTRQLVTVGYTPAQAQAVLQLAAAGVLTPRVARVFPLEACVAAHDLVEKRGVYGRVVLTTPAAAFQSPHPSAR